MSFDIAASAKRLRGLRAENNLSREKAAEQIGIQPGSLRGYEKGQHVMALETAAKLADLYHTTIDDIAGRSAIK